MLVDSIDGSAAAARRLDSFSQAQNRRKTE